MRKGARNDRAGNGANDQHGSSGVGGGDSSSDHIGSVRSMQEVGRGNAQSTT